MNVKQLAEEHGINYTTLYARLKRGWDLERALSQPVQPQAAPCHETGTKRCSRCGEQKPIAEFTRLKRRTGNEFAPACKVCDKLRTKKMRRDLRILIIKHYSNGEMKCSHCSESRIDVLDLDHINGGGIQERKKFKSPFAFYLWLRNEGFPSGYRILCRNCNWLAWIERKDGAA